MRGYLDTALLRDIIERHEVTQTVPLRRLVRHLLSNAAGLFSVNRFYNYLKSQGIRISKDVLHALLGFLEDVFLVQGVWLETASERRRMSNPRKFYPIDPGLIPVFDRSGVLQPSKALETVVAIELIRREAELNYLKTSDGYKVDLLARYPSGQIELIQVSAEIKQMSTWEREIRALLKAQEEFPGARCLLMTSTFEYLPPIPPHIEVQEGWEWLLSKETD